MTQEITPTQIDQLAHDLATLLTDRYPVDQVDQAALAAALPEFLRSVRIPVQAPADVEFVKHNHDGGQAMPFGRKKAPGQCPRCDQLRAGAAPREAHPALQAVARRRTNEEQTRAAVDAHFRPGGPHALGACGPVCTAFDS